MMNSGWGQPPEGGQYVYARTQGALPPIPTQALAVDQLRPQPEGTVAILAVRNELNGRIEGFGSRFLSHVQGHCRTLKEQFKHGGPLTHVSYCDRYISTPWALLLLREVFLDLVRERRADSRTALRLITRDLRRNLYPSRDGGLISDQWRDDPARETFVTQAIDSGRGRLRWKGAFEFEAGSAPHFRELRLKWENGAVWSLKLDQGVGYWRCKPSALFPFDQDPRAQVRAVNEIVKRCRVVSHGGHPTCIYIAPASA